MSINEYKNVKKIFCPRCGNEDVRFLGFRKGEIYCRKCLKYGQSETKYTLRDNTNHELSLNYSLSEKQQEISHKILQNYRNKKNTYVHAVCGAGKTEIVFETIKEVLINKGRVGFAIPRRDVVIELAERLKYAFQDNSISKIYGGSEDETVADIVVLTTHQLFQFRNYFDLLILDEADAFPYFGNKLLESFFVQSIKGNYIVMSATAGREELHLFKKQGGIVLQLLKRYHNFPLPVPKVVIRLNVLKTLYLVKKIKGFCAKQKPCLIFCPTIADATKLYHSLKKWLPRGNVLHSKLINRMAIISDFKKGNYDYLVTTSILERGVTIAKLQVIVFNADHEMFSREMLIQISGRVGRKINAPDGEVIFLAGQVTKEMEDAIREIESANGSL